MVFGFQMTIVSEAGPEDPQQVRRERDMLKDQMQRMQVRTDPVY